MGVWVSGAGRGLISSMSSAAPREAAGQIIQHSRIYTENIRLALECASTLTSRRKSAQAPASSCRTKHIPLAWPHSQPWPCHWRPWPGEATGSDSAWCSYDLSKAYTALLQTRPRVRPVRRAGRAGMHVTREVTTSAARPQPRKAATGPVGVKLLSGGSSDGNCPRSRSQSGAEPRLEPGQHRMSCLPSTELAVWPPVGLTQPGHAAGSRTCPCHQLSAQWPPRDG